MYPQILVRRLQFQFAEVVTFGEPRSISGTVGKFATGRHTRYVNGNDPATKFPPFWLFKYRHHGNEQYVEDSDGPNVLFDHSIVDYAEQVRRPSRPRTFARRNIMMRLKRAFAFWGRDSEIVTVYPTYGYLDGKQWIIPMRVWVHEPRNIALGAIAKVAGSLENLDVEELDNFRSRVADFAPSSTAVAADRAS